MKDCDTREKLIRLGTILLGVLVLAALGMFVHAAVVNARARAKYRDLSALIQRAPEPAASAAVADLRPESTAAALTTPTAPAAPPPTADALSTSSPAPLADYEELIARNPDFFGWIRMEGTRVDLPVMYSPQRPEQYLGHDFDGNFSYAGVPFLASECDPDGDYYLIHGHHMRDGSMFADLLKYEDPAFWRQYPTFRCDTRLERRTYAVVAAFRTRVLGKEEQGFRYYNYTALSDEKTFREFMDGVRAMAAYDTGVETAFGDQILTLSTCAYHAHLGRFVIVAKRVG